MEKIEHFLEFGLALVQKSSALIKSYNTTNLQVELKEDKTPVTVIDKKVEQLLCAEIRERFPDHGIIGEEEGTTSSNSPFVWTIDPIDGTQNLATGIPTYGTMLGLMHEGKTIVGVVNHPALDLTYYGGLGLGAFCNGERLNVNSSLGKYDLIATSTRNCFDRYNNDGKLFDQLHTEFKDARVLYDVFGHTQVVHGRLGALIEWNVHIWDIIPTEILITEGGGELVKLDSVDGYYTRVFGRKDLVQQIVSIVKRYLKN